MQISQDNMKALSAFAEVAREYCEFIDSLREGRPSPFYGPLENLLCQIHLLILPVEKEMADEDHPEFDKLEMSQEQFAELWHCLRGIVRDECLALLEWYECLRDASDEDSDHDASIPTVRDGFKHEGNRACLLPLDLAELYGDLHSGLVRWAVGTSEAQAEAAYEWRFNYEGHWYEHLFRAITTVHEARYQLHAE